MNQDYQSLPWAEKLRIAEAAKPGDVWVGDASKEQVTIVGNPHDDERLYFRYDGDIEALGLKRGPFCRSYHPAPPAGEDKPVTSISIQIVITDPDLVEYYAKESDAEIVDQILLGDLYTGVSIQRVERIRG